MSLARFKSVALPFAPLAEQARLAAEVDRLASVTETTLHEVKRALHRVQRLRQSILKWAFEGRLVDQDPTDESASVLLERIRAEREPVGNGKPGRGGRRRVRRGRRE